MTQFYIPEHVVVPQDLGAGPAAEQQDGLAGDVEVCQLAWHRFASWPEIEPASCLGCSWAYRRQTFVVASWLASAALIGAAVVAA